MRRDPGEDPNFFKISKFDIIFVFIILFFSSFCIAWTNRGFLQQPPAAKMALIYEKNKLIDKVSLEKDAVISLLNAKMRIEVKKGRIRVAQSDCPQHICMHMGWIQSSGQTILCVPNKVMVEIKSAAPALIDAVAN